MPEPQKLYAERKKPDTKWYIYLHEMLQQGNPMVAEAGKRTYLWWQKQVSDGLRGGVMTSKEHK